MIKIKCNNGNILKTLNYREILPFLKSNDCSKTIILKDIEPISKSLLLKLIHDNVGFKEYLEARKILINPISLKKWLNRNLF